MVIAGSETGEIDLTMLFEVTFLFCRTVNAIDAPFTSIFGIVSRSAEVARVAIKVEDDALWSQATVPIANPTTRLQHLPQPRTFLSSAWSRSATESGQLKDP